MLDIHLLPQALTWQQPNSEAGVQALIEQLQPFSVALVVVESTGGLERSLVGGLQAVSIRQRPDWLEQLKPQDVHATRIWEHAINGSSFAKEVNEQRWQLPTRF